MILQEGRANLDIYNILGDVHVVYYLPHQVDLCQSKSIQDKGAAVCRATLH